jgi:hypothetical protein
MNDPLDGRYVVVAGCWIWTAGQDSHGYPRVRFEGQALGAHRVSFYLANGYWPTVARHTCDTPLCVNPEHLIDGTPAQNSHDMASRGRSAIGERNPKAKLTWECVDAIRSSSMRTTDLAQIFGVNRSTIKRVRAGSHWR